MLLKSLVFLAMPLASVVSMALEKLDDRTTEYLNEKRSGLRHEHQRSQIKPRQWANTLDKSLAWSGAVAGDVGTRFESVSGSLIVPEPNFPYGYPVNDSSVSVWVGIGGFYTFENMTRPGDSLLQTGFYYSWTPDGLNKGMYAFLQWYPGPVTFYNVSDIQAGDELRIKVKQDGSRLAGTVWYENVSQNECVSINITAPDNALLDEVTAEWIVETWLSNGMDAPDFGTLTFTDLEATYIGGEKADLSDPKLSTHAVDAVPFWACCENASVVFEASVDVSVPSASVKWLPYK